MIQSILFAIEVISPILVMILLGMLLRSIGLIDANFIDKGAKIVFNIALPSLLFVIISRVSLDWQGQLNLVIAGILCTGVVSIWAWFVCKGFNFDRATSAIVIQGSFRSNLGISGIAYVLNAYGTSGLARSALFLGIITAVYNIFSTFLLNHGFSSNGQHSRWRGLQNNLISTFKNPMILCITAAMIVATAEWQLPEMLYTTASYTSQLALPLAMLLTGASIELRSMRLNAKAVMVACFAKTVLLPAVALVVGEHLGIRGEKLGVLFLMLMAPTAAASFIMVQLMGGDGPLAARIIAVTSFFSMIFGGIGLSLLDYFQLI